jgi:hypothetical protein
LNFHILREKINLEPPVATKIFFNSRIKAQLAEPVNSHVNHVNHIRRPTETYKMSGQPEKQGPKLSLRSSNLWLHNGGKLATWLPSPPAFRTCIDYTKLLILESAPPQIFFSRLFGPGYKCSACSLRKLSNGVVYVI